MIEGINIICFSDDWGRHPSSCQHIIGRLAKKNKVLWVNTIGMRNPKLTKYDIFRISEKIISWVKPLNCIHQNLYVYSPPMLPYNNLAPVRWLNKIIMIYSIRHILKRLGMDKPKPVLWTSVPNVCDVVGKLGEIKSVYYCYDEFAKWPGISHQIVKKMEDELVDKVNLILATSIKLNQEKKSSRCPTYLLSHGVDVEHFGKVITEDILCPVDLVGIKKPIIGTYGLFDERLDIDLLEAVALSLPQYSFVLVGRVVVDVSKLKQIKNIHFLKPVPYEMLPAYLKYFDVCFLMYRVIEEVLAYSNPLKLREFLAAGKTVVSTAIPEVIEYKEVVHIAETKKEFVEEVKLALTEGATSPLRQERIRLMMNESWDARVEEASRHLSAILKT